MRSTRRPDARRARPATLRSAAEHLLPFAPAAGTVVQIKTVQLLDGQPARGGDRAWTSRARRAIPSPSVTFPHRSICAARSCDADRAASRRRRDRVAIPAPICLSNCTKQAAKTSSISCAICWMWTADRRCIQKSSAKMGHWSSAGSWRWRGPWDVPKSGSRRRPGLSNRAVGARAQGQRGRKDQSRHDRKRLPAIRSDAADLCIDRPAASAGIFAHGRQNTGARWSRGGGGGTLHRARRSDADRASRDSRFNPRPARTSRWRQWARRCRLCWNRWG